MAEIVKTVVSERSILSEKVTQKPSKMNGKNLYRIGVVDWFGEVDGMPQVIHDELSSLGHDPKYFWHEDPIPRDVDIIFTWAPYGKLLPIFQQLESIPVSKRPITVHWNTEGVPDIRLPWNTTSAIGAFRSWIERVIDNDSSPVSAALRAITIPWEHRILRFRYLGDYYYAYNNGLLDVFADSSEIYAEIHNKHGLPTVVAPWGGTKRWYDDLKIERDIDVLWMGNRGTYRRNRILNKVRSDLKRHGVEIYFADGKENPFIFGKERTHFLNRAKITLNVARTWYDDNYSRFAMAAPNHSLIVSEPLLKHCSQYKPGLHFVSVPIDQLADTILYYLKQDEEREQIVESAYRLTTVELTFRLSMKKIMNAVDRVVYKKNQA